MTFYGSAAGFTLYTEERGKTVLPTWTTSVIEAALLLSSEWLDRRFEKIWTGYPTGGFTQTRKWPRSTAVTNEYPQYVFADDAIPDNVVDAVYEATFRELTTTGSLQKDYTPTKYNKVSVSGAISVEYDSSLRSSDIQLQIPVIEDLMRPLLNESARGYFSFYSGGSSRV